MDLLHIYDHTYYSVNGLFYSSGVFGAKSWEPYLTQFNSLTVLANLSDQYKEDTVGLDVSSREGVNFQFVDNKRLLSNYLKDFFVDDKKLINAIKNHDAIVVRLPSELGLIAIRLANKYKKPYAVEVVGCAWDSYWFHGTLKGKLMAPLSFYRMKNAIKKSPFVIYVTKQYLQRLYPTFGFASNASNVILPNSIRDETLKAHIFRLQNPPKKLKIGLSGTLNVGYKGHLESLQALSKIKGSIPDFELLFIGKGDPSWLMKLIEQLHMSDYARVIGKLNSGDAVFDFLNDLDIYLHPSKHEGLPRAVIEAMSTGCPVLASSIAGTPELLDSQYLHSPGDSDELSRQIKRVLTDKNQLCQMASDNFEKSKAYSFSNIRVMKNEFWKQFKSYAKSQVRNK